MRSQQVVRAVENGSTRWVHESEMEEPPHITAHRHSIRHRTEISGSEVCGCFYCLAIYPPSEIAEWVDEDDNGNRVTAICPRCGIDSVIGSKSGYPITADFLNKMHRHWFENKT